MDTAGHLCLVGNGENRWYDKIVQYIDDASSLGIEVAPPDVQIDGSSFSLLGQGKGTKILFGLSAVKNVGEGAVEEILRAREKGPFKSLEDFTQRVDTRTVNRKVVESLIKAGAFDFCGQPPTKIRPMLMANLERILERTSSIREDRSKGQESLFGAHEFHAGNGGATLADAPVWTEHELLALEKEVLGFYVSGHPLAKYKDELKYYSTNGLAHVPVNGNGGSRMRVAGIIANVRRLVSKAQKSPYARFKLEDLEGEIDCVVFPKTYAKAGIPEMLSVNKMVVVSGRLNQQVGDNPSNELIVEEILPLEKAREQLVKAMVIQVSTAALEDKVIEKLKGLLTKNTGACPVQFLLKTPSHGSFSMDPALKVKLTPELLQGVKDIVGEDAYRLIPRSLN